MTATAVLRTVDLMFGHHSRNPDHYLRRLAAEPLFAGVPRHLMPVVARSIDPLDLPRGTGIRCDPARETIIVTEGHVLLTDAAGRAVAAIGPRGVIGHACAGGPGEPNRILAASDVRAFVIGRRELGAVAAIAPAVAESLARRDAGADGRADVPARAVVLPRDPARRG